MTGAPIKRRKRGTAGETRAVVLRLGQDAATILDGVGNKTTYVDALVQDAHRQWADALAVLMATGWSAAEVKCACDALNGTWLVGHVHVQAELFDAQRVNRTAAKWGCHETWAARVEQAGRDEVRTALLTVVREFWRGNDALESAIDRLSGAASARG